jgi:hypothetical protein
MLTGIHFLLTYACTYECDHCFLYSGPFKEGTFTIDQLKSALQEIKKIRMVDTIYFEGGEPFLYYPLMLAGIKAARKMGFQVGIVSNAYWATSEEDAKLWLEPLLEFQISDLSISDDAYHYSEEAKNLAKRGIAAAKKLGLPVGTLCIEQPDPKSDKGPMYKGRAADKLTEGLPTKPCQEFKECPHEDLENPERVHLDAFGNVHICQGISMGNMWEMPLSKLVKNYHGKSHPICGPLIIGGPALLAKEYCISHQDRYVDACHFCYDIRKSLIDKFPQILAPKQVYGID